MSNEVIEAVLREYITKTPHMSLATVSDSKPWVCEVHFTHDNKLNLYFVSKRSTRHCKEIAVNPHVAGNIIRQHSLTEAPSGIYFEGDVEAINATQEDIERYCSALNRDVAEAVELLKDSDIRSMYRIKVRNWAVFGNFDGSGTLKHVLEWGRV